MTEFLNDAFQFFDSPMRFAGLCLLASCAFAGLVLCIAALAGWGEE